MEWTASLIIAGLFSLFVFIILSAFISSHWNNIQQAIRAFTVRNKPFSSDELKAQEQLPMPLRSGPAVAPFIQAIYSSVKRYQELNCYRSRDAFYFIARSKRYVLRISLVLSHRNKYLLMITFEAEHHHTFKIERPDWIAQKFRKAGNQLYLSKEPPKNSGLSKDEIIPFLEPLSFFNNISASEGILSADQILNPDSSMENWPQALSTFIRLGRFLMDTDLRKEILDATNVLCPYCRSDFSAAENTVSCRDCNTRHHEECWQEVGRCSVFGCKGKTEMIVTQA